jgi:hypothetical protein
MNRSLFIVFHCQWHFIISLFSADDGHSFDQCLFYDFSVICRWWAFLWPVPVLWEWGHPAPVWYLIVLYHWSHSHKLCPVWNSYLRYSRGKLSCLEFLPTL